MKKQTLRAVTMLVSIIALAFVTALASSAQSRGQRLRADIPFDFVVGDKTLVAGEYSIGQSMTTSERILVRSLKATMADALSTRFGSELPAENSLTSCARQLVFLSQLGSGAGEDAKCLRKGGACSRPRAGKECPGR